MRYVALLSGGKDSCYNILHCTANGHKLACVASLNPESGIDELDSFMYQTVGQDAIEAVANALDVPLYRKTIRGTAIDQNTEYGPRTSKSGVEGDETEDLYELLFQVKSAHSDVEGVSVGAILSNYQRVRVEHVCSRLSLTPLAYLWQRDQGELMSEMIEAGMNSILIKVAGVGLTPAHLGKSLAEMDSTFRKLHAQFGAHICGEGGEYETLTLDCPAFKSRIILDDVESVIHSDNHFATVAYLRVKASHLENKQFSSSLPTIPSLFDSTSKSIFSEMQSQIEPNTKLPQPLPTINNFGSQTQTIPVRCTSKGNWVVVGNVQRQSSGALDIQAEVKECFKIIQDHLSLYGLDFSHAVNMGLFLSSMSLFSEVNAVYAQYFGTSPPARATVAVSLPDGIDIRLECVAFKESEATRKQALHVQGLSYWAPANIGPYSQAIFVDERAFLSGQIGLIPPTLSLPQPPDIITESILSFQHVRRVLEVVKANSGGHWPGFVHTNIIWIANASDLNTVQHIQSLESANLEHALTPTLFVGVRDLPKGALVEKQVLAHSGRHFVFDDDGVMETTIEVPIFETREHGTIYSEECGIRSSPDSKTGIFCWNLIDNGIPEKGLENYIHNWMENCVLARLFHTKSIEPIVKQLPGVTPITVIPAHTLFAGGSCWDYAMFVQSVQ